MVQSEYLHCVLEAVWPVDVLIMSIMGTVGDTDQPLRYKSIFVVSRSLWYFAGTLFTTASSSGVTLADI